MLLLERPSTSAPTLENDSGGDYILFLRNVSEPIKPRATTNAGYGTIRYAEVFNEGYSSMETSYQCIFDGSDTSQKCDYGVRVCTDYIKLPSAMPTFLLCPKEFRLVAGR